MMRGILKLILLVCAFGTACSVEPAKINYGSDACHFCSMNIVDRGHAAQYVTEKGRSYSFDSIECMFNDLKDKDREGMAFILVADFENPGVMMNASESFFLVHPDVPSPMGEFLSAFSGKNRAEEYNADGKGNIYTWNNLRLQR